MQDRVVPQAAPPLPRGLAIPFLILSSAFLYPSPTFSLPIAHDLASEKVANALPRMEKFRTEGKDAADSIRNRHRQYMAGSWPASERGLAGDPY